MIKTFSLSLAIAAGVFFVPATHAQDKKSSSKIVIKEVGKDEDDKEEGKGLDIGKLLPLNKPNLKVKIPGFDKGELASMVEAEKLTRIDDVNLEMEDAIIQMIPQELTIKLRSGLYNTEGAILSSNDKSTISSKDFTITGDTLDFDTKTGKGRMTAKQGGRIRMLIHNVSMMGGGKEGAEKKGDASGEKKVKRTATKSIKEEPKK